MPTVFRRHFLRLGAAALLLPVCLRAQGTARVATDGAGTAIDGYDTTAYWRAGAAQPGTPVFAVNWKGVPWYFETAEAAAQFEAEPARYAPQFGGFCTRAMSFRKIVNGDPEVWRIYGEKLFLFAQPVGGEKFDEGREAMIAKAQSFWDSLN